MAKDEVPYAGAYDAATAMLALCRVGSEAAQLGWCLGKLRAEQIELRDGIVWRVDQQHALARVRSIVAMRRHSRDGHDRVCEIFGVPRSTVRSLLIHWSGEESAEFLVEALDDAVAEITAGLWNNSPHVEALTYLVGRLITLKTTTDQILLLTSRT